MALVPHVVFEALSIVRVVPSLHLMENAKRALVDSFQRAMELVSHVLTQPIGWI